MSSLNPDQFEAELKSLRPARPPQETLNRTEEQLSAPLTPVFTSAATAPSGRSWIRLVRWLAPAGAVAAFCAGLYLMHQDAPPTQRLSPTSGSSARPVLKADKVEIDRQLLADFDAVAKLPTGEPVRFRCQQWMDKVRWRDSAKGLVIEQTTPRLEIVPVRFETY